MPKSVKERKRKKCNKKGKKGKGGHAELNKSCMKFARMLFISFCMLQTKCKPDNIQFLFFFFNFLKLNVKRYQSIDMLILLQKSCCERRAC